MEIPRELSNKAVTVIVLLLAIVLFFIYRAYMNSRQAINVLETQVPNITRVAFESQLFAPTLGNIDTVLKKITTYGASSEMEKFKKELNSQLWIGIAIRNRGLKLAADISTRVRLATPITAIRGFNSTLYAKLETKEGGVGKKEAVLNWSYLEPKSVSFILLGVQPEDFAGKPPYTDRDMQLWSADFKGSFQFAEIRSKEGAFDYLF
ncbi:MAG: hypothetical protein ACREQW_02230 [Candidatus Binatia bacterium]